MGRIQMDPMEQLMVEVAVLREKNAQLTLDLATKRKNDVFFHLVNRYQLEGKVSVSDDYTHLEVPDPPTPPPAPPPPAPLPTPVERKKPGRRRTP